MTDTLHIGNPTRWGAEKQYLVRSWLPGYVPHSATSPMAHPDVWSAIAEFAPKILPDMHATAFMGFCANGDSPFANTTEAKVKNKLTGEWEDSPQEFHECGLAGTTGGPAHVLVDGQKVRGPAPNRDPHAKDVHGRIQPNNYVLLFNHPDVRTLLGRDAVMTDNGWKGQARDQIAIGLVDIRRSSRIVAAGLDPRIKPASDGTLWGTAIGFMGWSAGEPQAIHHIKPFVEQLAAVPEIARWGTLMHLVALSHPTGHKHVNAAYSCARTAQKLECGRMLAEFLGPTCPAWYDLHCDWDVAPLYEAIATLGYAS